MRHTLQQNDFNRFINRNWCALRRARALSLSLFGAIVDFSVLLFFFYSIQAQPLLKKSGIPGQPHVKAIRQNVSEVFFSGHWGESKRLQRNVTKKHADAPPPPSSSLSLSSTCSGTRAQLLACTDAHKHRHMWSACMSRCNRKGTCLENKPTVTTTTPTKQKTKHRMSRFSRLASLSTATPVFKGQQLLNPSAEEPLMYNSLLSEMQISHLSPLPKKYLWMCWAIISPERRHWQWHSWNTEGQKSMFPLEVSEAEPLPWRTC